MYKLVSILNAIGEPWRIRIGETIKSSSSSPISILNRSGESKTPILANQLGSLANRTIYSTFVSTTKFSFSGIFHALDGFIKEVLNV